MASESVNSPNSRIKKGNPNNSRRWRSNSEKARDRRRISDMYLEGKLQIDIAEAVGISQASVSTTIVSLQKEWLVAAAEDIAVLKQRELAKIDHLENMYFEAWEDSKKEKQIKVAEKRGSGQNPGPNDSTKTSIRKEERDGNAVYLAGVHWCIEQRCKILGLNAPVKQENVGETIFRVVYDEVPGGDKNA